MIIVDETEPVGELAPTFPYRDVEIRRYTAIRDAYEILDEIGRGKFGRVYKCRDRESGLVLAAKVVPAKRRDERLNVEREIEIMRRLHHPRIIQLFDAIEDAANWEMCLVLEMIDGGELFDRVIEDEFILTEKACSIFVRQICEGLEYIHSKSIVHLDMKPENVICVSKAGNRVKIIDFGLARFFDGSKKMQVLFGTPEFVAPEVVNFDEISYNTDMWSVGVITYVLLSGLSPFMGETDVQTMANVTIAKYDFDDECFDDVSDEAKDFIEKLLKKAPSERLTASESLKHSWLQPHRPGSESGSESELELEELPDLQQEDDTTASNSTTPDTLESRPSSAYLSAKRPSLDLSKDHLKEFVHRYSDNHNPYVFDKPKGIITSAEKGGILRKNCNEEEEEPEVKNDFNLVHQIRRFSKQLNEELEMMRQCHECTPSNNNMRKRSWTNVPV